MLFRPILDNNPVIIVVFVLISVDVIGILEYNTDFP